ncbi:MAG TPA: DUF423 domain-containing protein [Gammaproteobacteria bacterium]
MSAKTFLLLGSLNAMLAVILGAFGAHALKAKLNPELLAVYQTASQYHFYHSLGLLAVGVLMLQIPSSPLLKYSGGAMLAGIVLFSGSLYLLSVTGLRILGAITPVGGLCFIAGWLLLAVAVWKA